MLLLSISWGTAEVVSHHNGKALKKGRIMKERVPQYYIFKNKADTLAASNNKSNVTQAIEFYKKALGLRETEEALNGICNAAIKLGMPELYEEYALRGTELGYTNFYFGLGRLYGNDKIKLYNLDKSLEWLNKAVEAGSVPACKELAAIYLKGKGNIKADKSKAEKYLLKASEINNPHFNGEVHNLLGLFYRDERNYEKAFEEYKKAEELGYPQTYINIALAYKNGKGVEKDIEKYAEYLFKNLNYDSAREIGGLYIAKEYTEEDVYIAAAHFAYAMSFNDPIAAILYAACLIEQKGYNERELDRAFDIFFKYGGTDNDVQSNFEIIEEYFDGKTKTELSELAEKYWNRKNGLA